MTANTRAETVRRIFPNFHTHSASSFSYNNNSHLQGQHDGQDFILVNFHDVSREQKHGGSMGQKVGSHGHAIQQIKNGIAHRGSR